jgi:hypothetical protein
LQEGRKPVRPDWSVHGAVVALLVVAACGMLPPSPLLTETFAKREQALHIALHWNCRPAEGGGLLIEGVVEDTYHAQRILGLSFGATAYDKDGRRLIRAVGFPDGLHIGYEGWTRFRVLVPGGQAAARVDLGYEYHLPGNGDDLRRSSDGLLLRLAAKELYFGTIRDACRA